MQAVLAARQHTRVVVFKGMASVLKRYCLGHLPSVLLVLLPSVRPFANCFATEACTKKPIPRRDKYICSCASSKVAHLKDPGSSSCIASSAKSCTDFPVALGVAMFGGRGCCSRFKASHCRGGSSSRRAGTGCRYRHTYTKHLQQAARAHSATLANWHSWSLQVAVMRHTNRSSTLPADQDVQRSTQDKLPAVHRLPTMWVLTCRRMVRMSRCPCCAARWAGVLPLKSSARASAPRLEACSISSACRYGSPQADAVQDTEPCGSTSTASPLLLCGRDGRPAGEVSLQAELRD